ncbi:hypothetical protein BGX31_008898 [Mortierella sp. GBA43]|nr:hypothetical protein BGX31_008898 [Mortierella sp. GBA43]
MDLPVELEYIPYQEFQDRFAGLNSIARPMYPTIWPNVIMFFVFSGLLATAIVGISMTGTGLSIMSQGACFVLPIIAVIWIRVRKESKAKARKKFKQRSQKLLRAWTSEDFVTHAIQWKLRLRPKSAAKRWRTLYNSSRLANGMTTQSIQPIIVEPITITPPPPPPPQPSVPSPQPRPTISLPPRIATMDLGNPLSLSENAHNSNTNADNTLVSSRTVVIQLEQTSAASTPSTPTAPQLPTPVSPSSPRSIPTPATASPRHVEDIYATLRSHTQPVLSSILPRHQIITRSTMDPATGAGTSGNGSPYRSTWESLVMLVRNIYCCAFLFKEPKVWMIEISIREGMLDEYALPVPSPAYCGYRLPEYEDVIAGQRMSSVNSNSNSNANSNTVSAGLSPAGLPNQQRYSGPPPDYESDSENDSENEGEDDDDPRSDEDSLENTTANLPQRTLSRRSVPSGVISAQQPIEMLVVVIPSPSTDDSTSTAAGAGGARDSEQGPSSSCLQSSSSLSTCDSTLLSISHGDKEEGSMRMAKEE